jgi:hypothetical protein
MGQTDTNYTSTAKASAESVRESSAEAMGKFGDEAQQMADERRLRLAAMLEEIGVVADSAATRFSADRFGMLADYTGRFAKGLNDASRRVRQHSNQELWKQGSEFAHKRPELVVGGMFVAGWTLARYFKASESHQSFQG